jgi:vesicle coat complex subunit
MDTKLAVAITEIKEATKGIYETNKIMAENLKKLNDYNILHSQRSADEHKNILENLQVLTGKYWWLIIILMAVILAVLGYKEAIKFISP